MSPKWERTGEWVLRDTDDFFFDIDEYRCGEDQMIFCHIRFHKWSKGSLIEAGNVFWLFRAAVDCPLYAIGHAGDRKFERFVRRFGFRPLTNIHCADGKDRTVYISTKDQTGHVVSEQDIKDTEYADEGHV